MSLGLQPFQLGIITKDAIGQVPQLVVAQVPTKISLETFKVHLHSQNYNEIYKESNQ